MRCESLMLIFILAAIAGCQRELRPVHPDAQQSEAVQWTRMVNFQAGAGEPVGVQPVPLDTDYAKRKDYEENAYTVAEGKRLFSAFNCTGCHAHGGGDSGPPLMDDKWIYGSEPEQIFATLVEGRPNGMPSFGGRLPAYQLWQLTAYVRSLSGLVPSDAAPGRDDDLQGPPSEQSRKSEKPKDATPSKSTEMPE